MNEAIIHISDLHVTLHTKSNGTINTRNDSFLNTNVEKENSINYIKTFTDKIKKDFKDYKFYLVITGDISNSGEKLEFKFAFDFITAIIEDLNIDKRNCLIIPGDHDIHRRSLENELEKNPNDSSHLLNSVKFNNFIEYYQSFMNNDFLYDKAIFDHININDKIILLAINSNYKINNEGGLGYIKIDLFKNELEELKGTLNNEKLNYIACWHHNLVSGFENSNSGQWEIDNRLNLIAELERQNIKLIFTGNEHISSNKNVSTIQFSDCGAFSSIKHDSTFKVYSIKISDDIVLENSIYALQKIQGNDLSYFWSKRENYDAQQKDIFELYIQNTQTISEITDSLPYLDTGNHVITEAIDEPFDQNFIYLNSDISDRLYDIVRQKKLFHSGHFHWSETSRAHNWIDIAMLLENKEDLYFVNNAIVNVIETFELNSISDLIIGLGYEGNIISSKASIKFNIPYTSLPYSYRYEDHHDYEKKLNFNNDDAKYKNVILITDVVNDGRTIRKLIGSKEKDFFCKVDKIFVVSLFYTGHEILNDDILNYEKLPKDHVYENEYEVNKIQFYTVKSLRVEKCPYGSNYKEECFIFKDELSCVHLFYGDNQ